MPQNESLIKYQDKLKELSYCKLYDSASNYPRIVCPVDFHNPLPLQWLVDDFKSFLEENNLPAPADMYTPEFIGYQLPIVTGTVFNPTAGAIHRAPNSRHKYINTYKRFESPHKATPLNPLFLEFLSEFIKNDAERNIFCQYIGHAIQYPEQRPSWHLMWPSETGVGKGWLFEDVLNKILVHTQSISTFSKLTDKFSTVLESSILLLLDDCKAKTESTQTQLKSILSEERVYTEHKGKQGKMSRTYTRMILASNEDVPLVVDASERRWCVFEKLTYSDGLTGKEGRDDRVNRFIAPLSEWLNQPGAIESVYNYFATYSLDGFHHKKCPETQSLRELCERSESQELVFTREWLEDQDSLYVTRDDLLIAFDNSKLTRPSNNQLPHLFSSCGYKSSRPFVNGKKFNTIWHHVNTSQADLISAIKSAKF